MKNFFAALIILALIFAGCPAGGGSGNGDNDKNDDENEIGKTGPGGGIIFFAEGGEYKECSGELGDSTWDEAKKIAANYRGGGFTDWHLPTRSEMDLMYKNLDKNSLGGFSSGYYWTSVEDKSTTAYCQSFNNGDTYTDSKSKSHGVRAVRVYSKDTVANNTTLKMINLSFTEITDVIWQNVSFANNQYENSIKSGTNVTNKVAPGGGYIFFKRKSSPITARTKDFVVVENDQQIEYTFVDDTVIIEVNNPDNSGTLGALQSTVVWWDDAEGDMQPYYEARSLVMYYPGSVGFPAKNNTYPNSYANNYHPPKNGTKSIAVGGTATAKLHLRVNLSRKAKLSFWYANKCNGTAGAVFSINDEEERKWTTDINWSFMEVELDSGENDITWEKKDGGNIASNSNSYYLSLDDILIYYTE